MSHTQFLALLNLYNEFNEAFKLLPCQIKNEFYDILYKRGR